MRNKFIAIELVGDPSPSRMVVMVILFRIYKESLSNIVKHAKASEVLVSFVQEKGKLALTIRDNGIGLDGSPKTGRGLPNMKARAAEIGGTFAQSSDGGTSIVVEVPLP